MLSNLVGPFLILLTVLVSQIPLFEFKIFRRNVSKPQIAITLIVIAALGFCHSVWQSSKTNQEIKVATAQVKNLLDINSKLFCEASGGTLVNDVAYVVDDEKPIIFEFKAETIRNPSQDLEGTQPLEIAYQLSDKITLKEKVMEPGAVVETERVLTRDNIDDLEAIASFEGKLYIITSYSNSKKATPKQERQKLLEVSLDPQTRGLVTNSSENLRVSLEKAISAAPAELYKNEAGAVEFMHIEGLAIDPQGKAFFGLRTPLTSDEEYALVFSAKLSDLFLKGKEPQFKVFRLNLSHKNDNDNQRDAHYGIVSLDYDAQSGDMLVVGNSPRNRGYFSPILCRWDFMGERKDDRIQNPPCTSIPPYDSFGTSSKTSKIELLLLPTGLGSDRVFSFLDTDDEGNGGQLSYTRSELGLVKR